MTRLDRRQFVAGSLVLGIAGEAWAQCSSSPSAEGQGLSFNPPPEGPSADKLRDIAKRELARAGNRIWLKDIVGIADFTLPSSVPRFFLVDMAGSGVRPFLVTHGKGSDPEHTGFLQSFSNVEGSMATSRGAYVTYGWYDGSHGPSMRLTGLDADNSMAADRAIVIHGAPYANADMIPRWGKLGRSDGCFVFPEANLMEMLARLSPGRLLFADRL